MDRLYELTVTVPADTSDLAPHDVVWPLETAHLGGVTILVPDGHAGLTGIRAILAHQQIIPWGMFSWIVSNNEVIHVPFNDEINESGLVISTFNTDVFDHSFYLRAEISTSGEGPSPAETVQLHPAATLAAGLEGPLTIGAGG